MTDYTPSYPPGVAERAARLAEDLDLHGNAYLPVNDGMSAEQEIRAWALESASRILGPVLAESGPLDVQIVISGTLELAEAFAAYITDGTMP